MLKSTFKEKYKSHSIYIGGRYDSQIRFYKTKGSRNFPFINGDKKSAETALKNIKKFIDDNTTKKPNL